MSQDSDVSELSHTLSDGTLDQLRADIGDVSHYVDSEMLTSEDNVQSDYPYQVPSTSGDIMMTSNELYLPAAQSTGHYSYDQSFQNAQEQQNLTEQLVILPNLPQSPIPVTQPVSIDLLHARDDIPGDFGFELGFEKERMPLVKATPWTYSSQRNKMYAKSKKDIPIRFKLKDDLLAQNYKDLSIRVVVIYTKTEHSRIPVQRCPNHELPGGRKHIIECSNSNSLYGMDSNGGHYFVKFPLRRPEAGQQYILEFFSFPCLNTCPGGPDRREFHCVFLLELQDVVVGKQILHTKISTTPGRDKPKEEAKLIKNKSPLKTKVKQEEPTVQVAPQPVVNVPEVQVIKEEDDDEIYTIQVRGRKRYQELLHYKEALDLRDLVPTALLQSYRASCPPCGPNWLLEQQRQRESNPNVQASTSTASFPSTSNLPPKNAARFTMKRQTFHNETQQIT